MTCHSLSRRGRQYHIITEPRAARLPVIHTYGDLLGPSYWVAVYPRSKGGSWWTIIMAVSWSSQPDSLPACSSPVSSAMSGEWRSSRAHQNRSRTFKPFSSIWFSDTTCLALWKLRIGVVETFPHVPCIKFSGLRLACAKLTSRQNLSCGTSCDPKLSRF